MPTKREIENFSVSVEMMANNKGVTILEAISLFCQSKDIDLETSARLVSSSLKRKIKVEAENLNLLKTKTKRKTKLPL